MSGLRSVAVFKNALVCLAVLAFWAPAVAAQNVRVHLKVSADDEMKKALQTQLEDMLRIVPGVTVVSEAPDFTISVIALRIITKSAKDMGVAASVLITAPSEPKLKEFAESRLSPELGAQLASIAAGAMKSVAHWIELAPIGELQQVSRSIIQSFVKDVLSRLRAPASPAPSR